MSEAPALVARRFYYLRHGETEWNRLRLCQGSADIPLNADGRRQARAARQTLEGIDVATICVSPLSRARETAEIVGQVLDAPMVVIDGLGEIDFGAFEGQHVGGWWREWMAGAAPGGVEPYEAFMARALAAINTALGHPGPVLIVGHGGVYWTVQRHAPLSMDGTIPNGVPVRHEPPDATSPHWRTTVLDAGEARSWGRVEVPRERKHPEGERD